MPWWATLVKQHDPRPKSPPDSRGQAQGLTCFSPDEDQMLVSGPAPEAASRIMRALGGRAAEAWVFSAIRPR